MYLHVLHYYNTPYYAASQVGRIKRIASIHPVPPISRSRKL